MCYQRQHHQHHHQRQSMDRSAGGKSINPPQSVSQSSSSSSSFAVNHCGLVFAASDGDDGLSMPNLLKPRIALKTRHKVGGQFGQGNSNKQGSWQARVAQWISPLRGGPASPLEGPKLVITEGGNLIRTRLMQGGGSGHQGKTRLDKGR